MYILLLFNLRLNNEKVVLIIINHVILDYNLIYYNTASIILIKYISIIYLVLKKANLELKIRKKKY